MKLIIPYRLKSSRFPNKYISDFLGLPLIEHSLKLCEEFGNDVIVTAPKEDYVKEVSDLQEKYGFQFISTSLDCKTGTDRVIEISRNKNRAKVKGINIIKKHEKTTKEKKGRYYF